jgi:hypothetical protein
MCPLTRLANQNLTLSISKKLFRHRNDFSNRSFSKYPLTISSALRFLLQPRLQRPPAKHIKPHPFGFSDIKLRGNTSVPDDAYILNLMPFEMKKYIRQCLRIKNVAHKHLMKDRNPIFLSYDQPNLNLRLIPSLRILPFLSQRAANTIK